MPTTTPLTTANWSGHLAERKAYIKLVKISVTSLGDNCMRGGISMPSKSAADAAEGINPITS